MWCQHWNHLHHEVRARARDQATPTGESCGRSRGVGFAIGEGRVAAAELRAAAATLSAESVVHELSAILPPEEIAGLSLGFRVTVMKIAERVVSK